VKAIIIEDEKKARQLLRMLLNEHCPQVNVVDDCEDLPSGVKSIKKNNPDIVFLDIELPGLSGLQLLDFFNEEEINFSIIFVTAYNNYAIQAFKLSAIDYILKPINTQLLIEAVQKFEKISSRKLQQLAVLKANLSAQEDKKIVIPNRDSINYISPKDILYVKGEGAYATFYMQNNERFMLSRNLKYVEEMISGFSFLKRCHKSYIVNTNNITSLSKQDGLVTLSNNEKIPVSAERAFEV
jgi:two-component system, LytTR family, response regulator